jgi:hypothetical protein
MPDDHAGTASGGAPSGQIAVSPNNPCPFLRALVATGLVDGHIVPLAKLTGTIELATGEKGLNAKLAGLKVCLVALIANGLGPLRLLRSWWSGARLDALRDRPLDKHGVGSRILDATAEVNEIELARLAAFGKDRPDPSGAVERGLTAEEIKAYMDANFARAEDNRRWYDRLLMEGEWPVLLRIMGKGDGDQRYLSVAEVRTLVVERRLPVRIVERLTSQRAPVTGLARVAGRVAKAAVWIIAVGFAGLVVIAEFPNQLATIVPPLARFLPPPLPSLPPTKEAHWLEQNWSTEDRHWFHHASQGTATFPVPYSWFVALEQPGIHLFTEPGLLKDSDYLERFGFLPSPKTIHADQATLGRFGYSGASDTPTTPVPASVAGLQPTAADNFDGLPVGFARLTGAVNPGTGQPETDKIGLTCAACHTGSIRYQGKSVRFDGGPAMVNLKKLESATGLSIVSTLLPGRFNRFATRVLGSGASPEDASKLKKELWTVGTYLIGQAALYDKTIKGKGEMDTDEGFGRLDALNRIGNQVFYTDLATAGLAGFEKNLHANDAPVSFPPIWTVPWFLWAQYDASIEQPIIRNAGEALGVYALVNLSPDTTADALFRSTVAIENLDRIETMLRGPDPSSQKPMGFAGLKPPKWPSQLFADDPAWKIDPARVEKGRAIYAEICVECHLGPVDDPVFDQQYPAKSFWSSKQWDAKKMVLDQVQKPVAGMGTDPGQANVLAKRRVEVPGFLNLQPREILGDRWGCPDMPAASSEMPYSIALMMVVDVVSRKWMADRSLTKEQGDALWGPRRNCPNDGKNPEYSAKQSLQQAVKPRYRARPLNGVWATAPYLHNGSVPSLYWLLSPAAERPKEFCMGLRDFDPHEVGFLVPTDGTSNCKTGETLFSTTNSDGSPALGNGVLGHSLEATPGADKPGVIGRLLQDDERYDLIEYLKTL